MTIRDMGLGLQESAAMGVRHRGVDHGLERPRAAPETLQGNYGSAGTGLASLRTVTFTSPAEQGELPAETALLECQLRGRFLLSFASATIIRVYTWSRPGPMWVYHDRELIPRAHGNNLRQHML
jgi:hypothetical protein